MAVLTAHQHRIRPSNLLLRGSIVGLTLATAAIHFSLGGTLFLFNAIGYAALAVVMQVVSFLAVLLFFRIFGTRHFRGTYIL